MINNSMIQLAATTHQRELRRVAASRRSVAGHHGASALGSRHAQRMIAQLLNVRATRAAHGTRATQPGSVAPRLSI